MIASNIIDDHCVIPLKQSQPVNVPRYFAPTATTRTSSAISDWTDPGEEKRNVHLTRHVCAWSARILGLVTEIIYSHLMLRVPFHKRISVMVPRVIGAFRIEIAVDPLQIEWGSRDSCIAFGCSFIFQVAYPAVSSSRLLRLFVFYARDRQSSRFDFRLIESSFVSDRSRRFITYGAIRINCRCRVAERCVKETLW